MLFSSASPAATQASSRRFETASTAMHAHPPARSVAAGLRGGPLAPAPSELTRRVSRADKCASVVARAKSMDEEDSPSMGLFGPKGLSPVKGERVKVERVIMPAPHDMPKTERAAANNERAAAISSIVGKVLWYEESLAVVAGLNSDAPIGTKLSFVSGGTGVLLWHRSDHLSLVMVLGGAQSISVGAGVECKLSGVLQVMDDGGPVIRKDYEMFQAPTGDSLFGRVSNFFGMDLLNPSTGSDSSSSSGNDDFPSISSATPPGFEKSHALLQQQVAIKNRDQITESLFTGVKGIDILTPVGRGSSLLLIGPKECDMSSIALDAVFGQKTSGVVCVYASVNQTETSLRALMGKMEAQGCAPNTAIIAAVAGAPLGEQFAAICTACAVGERIRDEGGHSLVILDSLNPLVEVWEAMLTGLSSLGRVQILEGLMKDSEGRDVVLPEPEEDEELVDYEGMLVSGAVAQRRGFFSTLFMRAAKINVSGGGGSMTLMPLVPGRPATGVSMRVDMSKYQTISEEQKKKIEAVLQAKLDAELKRVPPAGELTTEMVEEFISIADGQIVFQESSSGSVFSSLNPKQSITRVGSRAYPKALERLAPQIRLNLNQAEDARKFALNGGSDKTQQKFDTYSRRILAALMQPSGEPVALEELVVTLLAIQRGPADNTSADEMPAFLLRAVAHARAEVPAALEQIATTKMLTAASEKAILGALATMDST